MNEDQTEILSKLVLEEEEGNEVKRHEHSKCDDGHDDDDEDGNEDDEWGQPTLEQRARRLQRAKDMGSNETQFLQDALIFSDPNYAK